LVVASETVAHDMMHQGHRERAMAEPLPHPSSNGTHHPRQTMEVVAMVLSEARWEDQFGCLTLFVARPPGNYCSNELGGI
jgi:hypothetical protein